LGEDVVKQVVAEVLVEAAAVAAVAAVEAPERWGAQQQRPLESQPWPGSIRFFLASDCLRWLLLSLDLGLL
jgi:hypothetical protein